MTDPAHPHAGQPLLVSGSPPGQARAAVLLVHGRGGSAAEMLDLGALLAEGAGPLARLAPQAAGHTWYPHAFLAPPERNQPWLDSALRRLDELLDELEAGAGLPAQRVALVGFSQGACLALEYAARRPRRYGALVGLSGGRIGPPGAAFAPPTQPGSLEGTPVFLGCSDADPHIPLTRVVETDQSLTALGARVTRRIYPGMGHLINEDELRHARALVAALTGASPASGAAR